MANKKSVSNAADKRDKTSLFRRLLGIWRVWPLMLVLLVLWSLVAPYYVYSRLNSEQPVARLEFESLGKDWYLASVTRFPECTVANYRIQGDQWQLDASFLKWKGIAVLLGADSRVALDRLSGRFSAIEQARSSTPSVHELKPDTWFAFGESLVEGTDSFLVDTRFGSSAYMSIDPEKSYWVYKTEDALIARSLPRNQTMVEEGVMTLVIDQSCGDSESDALEAFARQWNQWLLTAKQMF